MVSRHLIFSASIVTARISRPVLVAQYSVPDYDQLQARENAIALLKLITLSEKDKAEGKVFSREQLMDGI